MSEVLTREVTCKSILGKTGIPGFDYAPNPYTGCEHACRYCYAAFMGRYSGHDEAWGSFVDIKLNAPAALRRQLRRARKGRVMVSSVTDPYQPVERRYRLTRQCLEILLERQFAVSVLTRSPLCTRDIDLFRQFEQFDIGLSVPTDAEPVKSAFEACSPAIAARVHALRELHAAGLKTFAFIGPLLPMHPDRVFSLLEGAVDEVLIDRLNYDAKVRRIYAERRWQRCLTDEYFEEAAASLTALFAAAGVGVRRCF